MLFLSEGSSSEARFGCGEKLTHTIEEGAGITTHSLQIVFDEFADVFTERFKWNLGKFW